MAAPTQFRHSRRAYTLEKQRFIRQVDRIMFHRTLTYAELAFMCGISHGTISRMFTRNSCSASTMRKLLIGLQLTMDDLLAFDMPGVDVL
ncbi:MAG: helix-turn-helix domain-containing protein [Deltaproteobacteria bacterium]|jgi:DNA-binding Xre family transcriptional regulator|nr:helix-turn-helix domain-containing protein [Deltaproteobacteria bacterium]